MTPPQPSLPDVNHAAEAAPRGESTVIKTIAMFAAACGMALALGAGPSSAAEMTVSVSGDSVPSNCGAAKSAPAASELTGSLTGCLATFPEHVNCRERNGFAFSTELGREEFEGQLEGKPIAFTTIYSFEAVWPAGSCPTPSLEAEIAGGCIHYISGDGVQGLIRFYDVIPVVGKGATNFFYEGVLNISDAGTAAIAPVVPPHDAMAMAAATGPRPLSSSTC
jgi:hypothetical protein